MIERVDVAVHCVCLCCVQSVQQKCISLWHSLSLCLSCVEASLLHSFVRWNFKRHPLICLRVHFVFMNAYQIITAFRLVAGTRNQNRTTAASNVFFFLSHHQPSPCRQRYFDFQLAPLPVCPISIWVLLVISSLLQPAQIIPIPSDGFKSHGKWCYYALQSNHK